jgi:diaminopimelate decarboxylase
MSFNQSEESISNGCDHAGNSFVSCGSKIEPAQHGEASLNPSTQKLPARLSPDIRDLLRNRELLFTLMRAFGSPLNLLFPETVIQNSKPFLNTFKHYNLDGRVFFTSKPNRSSAVLREVSSVRTLGVDVSSVGSLQAALKEGVCAERLEATGPKNQAYLTLCMQHDVLMNIDNIGELQMIVAIRRRLGLARPARVTIRLSGFASRKRSFAVSDSTFGTPVSELSAIFSALEEYRSDVVFLGFSFHLYTDSLDYKLAALQETLQATLEARRRGFQPTLLNIGGGFRISYVSDSSAMQSFFVALKESLLYRREPVTWNRGGLGLRVENGKVVGAPKVLEHTVPLPPADQLCALLKAPLPDFGEVSAAQLIDELGLQLHIEPGRALLDQAGITLARVAFQKRSERGELLTALEMNRSNLNAGELTLLADPILLSQGGVENSVGESCETFLMGNLCVANELLTPRKVSLARKPEIGDIVAFANTAPYCMDFAESPTLHQNVAEKVALRQTKGEWQWFRDGAYVPYVLEGVQYDS